MACTLHTETFDPGRFELEETLFHTANGYLGVRANFEEGYAAGVPSIRGTYLSAFYDTHEIHHPERLYAFPETGEKIVNVTDAQTIQLSLDGERMVLEPGNVTEFARVLDLDGGFARRSFVWTAGTGRRLRVTVTRLASFTVRELFAVRYEVEALDGPGELKLHSVLNGNVSNFFDASDPRVSGTAFKPLAVTSAEASGTSLAVESRTEHSGLSLAVLSLHQTSREVACVSSTGSLETALTMTVHLERGEPFVLVRRNVFADSLRHQNVHVAAGEIGRRVAGLPFDRLLSDQKAFLDRFWENAGIGLAGDEKVLFGLRYNLFELLQSAPADARGSIAAKGLSGEGYEGHYFWDTETYMAPFFTYTNPAIARNLLAYRHSILPGAREHARNMGQKRGAAYPWRTIAGRECSPYFPSGSAQYHINADIAYSFLRYFEATGDLAFMAEKGAEVLFETARTWIELGHYLDGQFRIDAVTGPDEYTCIVDNNYYTNAMAQHNLRGAAAVYRELAREKPEELRRLATGIGLGKGEPEDWEKAAEAMYLPWDERLDINPQDDGFLKKAVWDFAGTPRENYPLLLHYHHLTIRRYQVCKQADTVLAHFLLPGIARESTVRNSYAYYERITTHDSSLSYAAFGIMAARLGEPEKAYDYFMKTALLDLEDTHGNAKDGIHAANMGGAWLALVFGFGGFLPAGDAVSFAPCLPAGWAGISFRVRYRGRFLAVSVRHGTVAGSGAGGRRAAGTRPETAKPAAGCVLRVELLEGSPISVMAGGAARLLSLVLELDV